VQSMPPMQRAMIKALPVWLRSRMLLRLAQQLVHSSYTGSRAIARLRKGTASFDSPGVGFFARCASQSRTRCAGSTRLPSRDCSGCSISAPVRRWSRAADRRDDVRAENGPRQRQPVERAEVG